MAGELKGTAVYLLPGMQIKLKIPINPLAGQGSFARRSALSDAYFGESRTPTRGFVVENEDVGTIVVTDQAEAAVTYTHKKAEQNSIWFFGVNEEDEIIKIGVVNVISVPIHDHSSIVQGGPAYGTYFTDDEEQE